MANATFARQARRRRPDALGAGEPRDLIPRPMLVAGVVSFAVTAAVVLVRELHFAYRQPELHLVLETAAALIGLLAS